MPITGKSGSPWRRDDQAMALPCGSASTRRTRRPFLAKAAARLTEIVVLPLLSLVVLSMANLRERPYSGLPDVAKFFNNLEPTGRVEWVIKQREKQAHVSTTGRMLRLGLFLLAAAGCYGANPAGAAKDN